MHWSTPYLRGDFVVVAVSFEAADLDHDDDEVGILDGLAAVGAGGDGGGEFVVADHAGDEGLHAAELGFRRRHEGEVGVAESGRGEDVGDEGLAEDDGPGTDHGDFEGHGFLR